MGTQNTYLGKIISKDNFRVYIYSTDGQKKLVNSWDEFQINMATGLWFAKKSDALELQKVKDGQKSKPKRKQNQKIETITKLFEYEENETLINDKFGFEVNTEHDVSVTNA